MNLVISAVGDVSLEGNLRDMPTTQVFSRLVATLDAADLVVANLESPLTLSGNPQLGKCTLRGDPGWAMVLKKVGIKLVSLANNHMMDYGFEGLFDTIRALDSAEIMHLGAGRNIDEACSPLFVTKKGKRIAFLARSSVIVSSSSYAGPTTPGVAFLETEELVDNIKRCKKRADLVIVLLHWGLEEYAYPTPSQLEVARRLVDSGADAIIGHHPHVLQGIQRIGKGFVAYSLGNFLFNDFEWRMTKENGEIATTYLALSEHKRKGIMLSLEINENASINSVLKVFTRVDHDGCILIDGYSLREEELRILSDRLRMRFYAQWWRIQALYLEWKLRIKPRLSPQKIIRNFCKIRPRHFVEMCKALKKSINISNEKTTNPYE
ncbi:MAG: Capsule biosynthesis protein CapA [Syntrophorhabdus sp. PtaU1.Bin002]|nr:MAG: Capsule biosynthesis protein CapA [Syntrophorhabdus sp. PtaU1.Bin002]